MTQAQKTAKAKFKQAIAYRQKTGVTLKEAFAHIYGKKTVTKKKVAKKVAKKRIGKVDNKLKKTLAKKGKKMPHGYDVVKRTPRKRISGIKRKPTEKQVLKSIKNAVKVQKSHMSGLGKVNNKLFNSLAEVKKLHKEQGGHWFDTKTMKFFNSKINSTLIGGKYFIYSNKMPYHDRYYAIAEAFPSGNVFPLDNSPHFTDLHKAKEYLHKYLHK